jgi:hypothetical protein
MRVQVVGNDRASSEVGFEASTSDTSGSPAHPARQWKGPNEGSEPRRVLRPVRLFGNRLSERQPLAGRDSGVPNWTGQADARSRVGTA